MDKVEYPITCSASRVKEIVCAIVDVVQNDPKTKHLTDGEVVNNSLSNITFIFYEKENKDNSDILYITIEKLKDKSNNILYKYDFTGKLKLANSDKDTEFIDIDFKDLDEMEDILDIWDYLKGIVVPNTKELKNKLTKICIDKFKLK